VPSAGRHFTSADACAAARYVAKYVLRPAKHLRLTLAQAINVTAYETRHAAGSLV